MSERFDYCMSCGKMIVESDKNFNIKMCDNCVEHQMREK